MINAIALTGPTASGKTATSIEIAKRLGCEIISLDSMQIYRGMDIGTAKATPSEQAAVPHHMIDLIEPWESFSANAYKERALAVAEDISKRGKIPFFVGGTGLYLSTLIRPDCETPPESNPEYREKLFGGASDEEGKKALWERLLAVDEESALAIHYNNVKRVIRALEIYDTTGKTKTYFDSLTKKQSDKIRVAHVTLDFHRREALYSNVDKRVDEMMKAGLVPEVMSLLAKGHLKESATAYQAIGYKEIIDAIECGMPPESATDTIKQASRNYAKRQLTWFRHAEGAVPVFADCENGSLRPRKDIILECLDIFERFLTK